MEMGFGPVGRGGQGTESNAGVLVGSDEAAGLFEVVGLKHEHSERLDRSGSRGARWRSAIPTPPVRGLTGDRVRCSIYHAQ